MKKTQRKDARRNVKKQWVSFLSIVVIALMGVTAFLGIDYTSTSMRKIGSEFYNETNFRDIEVVSTLLFSEEDLSDLRKIGGVADVEPVRLISTKIKSGSYTGDVDAVSMTERISQVELLDGRLPTDVTECAIEGRLAEESGLKVGSKIKLTDASGQLPEYLSRKEFVITGIVSHPDHVNHLIAASPYVFLTWDAFDSEALNNCFMKAEIVVDKPIGIYRFSKEYNAIVDEVIDRIETLSIAATKRRDKVILDLANEKIESAKALVEDGFDQIEDAKATVRNKIREAYEKVFKEDADRKLLHWAEPRKANVDDPNESAMDFWITENIRIDLSRPLTEILEAVAYSKSVPDSFLAALYIVTQHEEDAPKKGGAYDMETIRKTLIEESMTAASAYTQLADACAQWDEGHAQYIEGKAQYDAFLADLQPCRWIPLSVKGNASFVQLTIGSGDFAKLRSTFSILFIVVGALVIFATVGKMVDEQRTLVGTTKALGFFNSEIFAKYLGFGISATLLGTILGILTARFAIAPFLLFGFDQYYTFNMRRPMVDLLPTVIVVFAGVLLAVAAIWLACSKLLREPATRLMQSKMPTAKRKRGQKNRLRGLSLYSRLILLNMRMDLKRVVVTIVSVAGCCALIIIGFTLSSALRGAVTRQYGEVVDYDLTLWYDTEASPSAQSDLETILDRSGAKHTDLFYTNATYKIKDLEIGDLYCGDIEAIHRFFRLNEWKTGEQIHATSRGILIQRRMAETYSFDVGSEFEISIGGTRTATVRVAGIFENFIGKTMIMSKEYYETLYGEIPDSNLLFVKTEGADEEALIESFKSVKGYAGYTRADADRSIIEDSTAMINTVVLLFIVIAAVMAGVVLLNLTNMYVLQKKRELTIMRVNGFSTREVIFYMLRETFLTTALGILFGIFAGTGIAYRIVRTIEQVFLQFDRRPNCLAWLIAALMTIFFTVIVNYIALRKVKNLRLTDVA